jgi:large subunit ribosomal protein L44
MASSLAAAVGNKCLQRLVTNEAGRLPPATLSYQQVRGLRRHQEKTIRAMYWRGRSFDRLQLDANSKRSDMQEWNYRSEIFAFSRRLHENLSEDTLRQVFTQPSYAKLVEQNQAKLNLPHIDIKTNNELRRSGEQLLDHFIRPYLRCMFNRMPEDGIDHISRYLMSDETLADVAKWIGCKEIILSEEYPPSQQAMASTVRALVGGIHSEAPNKTRRFIVDMIISYLNDKDILDDVWIIPNPQETLNLILANSQMPAYEPRIMFQTGVGTLESCHVVGLYSNKKLLGSSAGETLKIAENCAALESLRNLFDLGDDRPPFVYGDASDKIDYERHKKEHPYVKTWRFEPSQ